MTDIENKKEERKKYSMKISKLRYDHEIDEAILVCKEASNKFPTDNFFYKLQGDLYIQLGNYDKAFFCYLEQLKYLEGKAEQLKSFIRFYRLLEKSISNQELLEYKKQILDAIERKEIADDISYQLIRFLGTELAENTELQGLMEATDDDRQLQKVKKSIDEMVSHHDKSSIQAVIRYRISSINQKFSRQTNQFLVSIAEKEEMYDEALQLIQKINESSNNATVIRALLRICRKLQDYSFAENMLMMDKEFVMKSDFNIQYELVYYYEYNHNVELLELTLKRMRDSAASSVPIARTLYNFYLRFNMFDEARLMAEHIKNQEEKLKGSVGTKRIEEQFESEQGIWNKLQELVSEREHNRQMIALRDLIRGFSHELGQPITNIRYSIQLYQMKFLIDKSTTEDIDELLNLILYQTERIGTMLSRFRPIVSSRSTEETFNVYERVQTVFDDLEHRLRMQNISYSLTGDKGITLWGDPIQFDQIFYNLILNSIQAIAGEEKSGNISVRISRVHSGEIQIIFMDNGPGIAKENIRKIFEPFFTTKDPSADNGGEGLGLFIVWNILKMFNGRIMLDSKYEEGAKFRITITNSKGENE